MIRKICSNVWQRGKNALQDQRFLLKPTLILAFVYLIAMSAIIRSNYYYDDDIARALNGYSGWGFSRVLSNFLSQFLHADSYLTDISPLPQVIAVFLIALTSVIAVHLITGEKEFSFWHFVAAVPIGISPFFLECLSFKYDSPYMALSMLFSVAPLLFCGGKPLVYVLATAAGMVGMCTTYQASSGVFPMLVIVLGIRRWVWGEKTAEVMKFYAISAAGYLLGIILFRKVIMTEFIAYASTTAASASELIPCTIANYKKFLYHFLTGFKPAWLGVSFLICVCFLWTAVSVSRHNKLVTLALVSAAMLVMFLLSFGVYPFLVEPLFSPRSMYGIGCFIAFLGIFAVTQIPKGYPAKAACLVLSWFFFVFSFTYGNALSVQAQYTDFRITQVISDLKTCEALASGEEATLQITGTIGYSPVIENMLKDFPILKRLIPVTFCGDGWWGEYGLRYYYCLPNLKFADSYDPPTFDLPVIADNYYHTIRANESYIWIDLH